LTKCLVVGLFVVAIIFVVMVFGGVFDEGDD
jgi:hypothetical protein